MSKELNQQTNLEAKVIIPERPEVNENTTKTFEETLSVLGHTVAKPVAKLSKEDLSKLPKAVQRALTYSNSTIIDAGPGITALVDATPEEDQTFSTLEVDQALINSGLIHPNSTILKMGASGAVLEDENNHKHGAEVIEATVIQTREKTSHITQLTNAAWTDDNKKLHVDPLKKPNRVLLENQFIATKQPLNKSNAILAL